MSEAKKYWDGKDEPQIGDLVSISSTNDIWEEFAHLVGCPVTVMATFAGLGKELCGTNIQMVAVSNSSGTSACFRADMCSPIDTRTDKEKAVDELMAELSKNNSNDEDRASIAGFYDKWVSNKC